MAVRLKERCMASVVREMTVTDTNTSRNQSPHSPRPAVGHQEETLGYWDFIYRRISAVRQCKPLRGSQKAANQKI